MGNHSNKEKFTQIPLIINEVEVLIKHSFNFYILGFTEKIPIGTKLSTKLIHPNKKQSEIIIDPNFKKAKCIIRIYIPYISILNVGYYNLNIDVLIAGLFEMDKFVTKKVKVVHIDSEILNLFGKNKNITEDFLTNIEKNENCFIYKEMIDGIYKQCESKYKELPQFIQQFTQYIPNTMDLHIQSICKIRTGYICNQIEFYIGTHKHTIRRLSIKSEEDLVDKLLQDVHQEVQKASKHRNDIQYLIDNIHIIKEFIDYQFKHYMYISKIKEIEN